MFDEDSLSRSPALFHFANVFFFIFFARSKQGDLERRIAFDGLVVVLVTFFVLCVCLCVCGDCNCGV